MHSIHALAFIWIVILLYWPWMRMIHPSYEHTKIHEYCNQGSYLRYVCCLYFQVSLSSVITIIYYFFNYFFRFFFYVSLLIVKSSKNDHHRWITTLFYFHNVCQRITFVAIMLRLRWRVDRTVLYELNPRLLFDSIC